MASDQSDTSGSQVRQFGLYRSIDSRTEEFLRLSRKRQMRQGCACAAISTAITVTIIIGILLVFEFNIPIDTENKSVQKCNSFLNDTAEAIPLNKPNTNTDKATLKILPTLMKALNRSKIIESTTENTSNNPFQEKRHTTEFALKKNLFSNRNSWRRYPTSKVYTVEYKTSPVVYFKTPKNDYYTKIRKIRDYQRIINYVDKMISERVPFGATQPMRPIEDYSVDDPSQGKITTPAQKTFNNPVDPDESSEASMLKVLVGTTTNRRKNEDKNKCKCPDKIARVINSLISNIKLLAPHFSTTESVLKKLPCDKIHKLRIINNDFSSSRDSDDLQVNDEISKELLKQGTSLPPHMKLDSNVKNSDQVWHPSFSDGKNLNTIFGLLQQRFVGQKTYLFKTDIKNIITTPPMFIEKTEIIDVKSTTPKEKLVKYDPLHLIATAPDYEEDKNNPDEMLSEKVLSTSNVREHYAKYAPLHFIANRPDVGDNNNDDENMSLKKVLLTSGSKVYPVKNNSLQFDVTTKYNRQGNRENEKGMSEKDDENNRDSFSTTTNTAEKYLNLDVHSLELLKKKRISTSVKNDKTIIKPYTNHKINALSTKPNTKWYLSKENSEYNNIFYPIVTTHFLYHRHNGTSKCSLNSESITTTENTSVSLINDVSTVTIFDIENKHTSPSVETFNVTSNCSKTKNEETDLLDFDQKDKEDIRFHLEELNLDEDLEKVIDEDNYQDNYIKDDYSSTMDNKLDVPTEKNVASIAADKVKEDTSNVLNIKPRSYLEIQGDYFQHGEDDDIFIKRLFDYIH